MSNKKYYREKLDQINKEVISIQRFHTSENVSAISKLSEVMADLLIQAKSHGYSSNYFAQEALGLKDRADRSKVTASDYRDICALMLADVESLGIYFSDFIKVRILNPKERIQYNIDVREQNCNDEYEGEIIHVENQGYYWYFEDYEVYGDEIFQVVQSEQHNDKWKIIEHDKKSGDFIDKGHAVAIESD